MKRVRGRPARILEDIQLVWSVRNARDRGLTVLEACKEHRRQVDNKGPSAEQLKRRYERAHSAYPDKKIEIERRLMGLPLRRLERQLLGGALLTWDRVRPVK